MQVLLVGLIILVVTAGVIILVRRQWLWKEV